MDRGRDIKTDGGRDRGWMEGGIMERMKGGIEDVWREG